MPRKRKEKSVPVKGGVLKKFIVDTVAALISKKSKDYARDYDLKHGTEVAHRHISGQDAKIPSYEQFKASPIGSKLVNAFSPVKKESKYQIHIPVYEGKGDYHQTKSKMPYPYRRKRRYFKSRRFYGRGDYKRSPAEIQKFSDPYTLEGFFPYGYNLENATPSMLASLPSKYKNAKYISDLPRFKDASAGRIRATAGGVHVTPYFQPGFGWIMHYSHYKAWEGAY